jgi:pyridoxal 5'-phosphate synthase pdxT subunit
MPVIGVLAIQGSFREHIQMLERMGVESREVRLPAQLQGLDGLIIPGGESTTIGKLMVTFGLLEPLRVLAQSGLPMWGTCAGMILLARDIGPWRQPILGVMDVKVERNAFGRQSESFETDLLVTGLDGAPFHAVFIRAPLIEAVGPDVEVLARLENGTIVAARQGHLLATSFHPELTEDPRVHRFFVSVVEANRKP